MIEERERERERERVAAAIKRAFCFRQQETTPLLLSLLRDAPRGKPPPPPHGQKIAQKLCALDNGRDEAACFSGLPSPDRYGRMYSQCQFNIPAPF